MRRDSRSSARWTASICLSLGIASFGADSSVGQAPEIQRLSVPTATSWDAIGWSIDVCGDVLVVGAPTDSDLAYRAGSASVFRFDGVEWIFEQTLTASDAEADDWFGYSVACERDRILVGAPLESEAATDAGACYVFEHDGQSWSEQHKLMAPDAGDTDYFGWAIDLDQHRCFIGAPSDDGTAADTGSAYIFAHDGVTWASQHKLTAPDEQAGASFGYSVALQDDLAVIGTPYYDGAGANEGKIYTFDEIAGMWVADAQLTADDHPDQGWLGYSVAVDGDRLAGGAPGVTLGASIQAGAVYVFEYRDARGTWKQDVQLTPTILTNYDAFGSSVAVTGTRVIVGTPGSDERTWGAGTVSSFENRFQTWEEEMRYAFSLPTTSELLGTAVAAQGNRAFAGAPYAHDVATYSGAVAVLQIGEFTLDVDPPQVSAGETLTFLNRYGFPGQLVLFYLSEVNGSPFTLKILTDFFQSDFQYTLSSPAPPGLEGHEFGFSTFTLNVFGSAEQSNIARVSFQ